MNKKNPEAPRNLDIIAGRNVNMVSGTQLPYGDPWLQRQNEPSIAVSTRNPLHLLAGANDYRTIDIPGEETDILPGQEATGTAQAPREPWLGVYKSFDGGQSWITTLLPGFPQDNSPEGLEFKYQIGLLGLDLHAAADPIVRAGISGLFYYTGIVFDRQTKKGIVFVSRFIDNNNKENGDCIKYLDTKIIDNGTGGQFIDKPWIAVDIPRNNRIVTIDGQEIPEFNVYIAYSIFLGDSPNNPHSKLLFARSTDCGDSWDKPTKLSESENLNQGATIGVDFREESENVYVAWRRFKKQTGKKKEQDAILVAKSWDSGRKFDKSIEVATFDPFDQGSSVATFRTNSYPSTTVDQEGRIYLVWAQRMGGEFGDARIVLSTSGNGSDWLDPPLFVEDMDEGHQVMPSLTYAAGKLMLVWYDQRRDISDLRGPYIQDETGSVRHTLDVRAAQADPGLNPVFEPSKQISRYIFVLDKDGNDYFARQIQFNYVNYPLFKTGTWPFIGDYIDISPSPAFVLDESGHWRFNTEYSNTSVFHAVWTDNRDVRRPVDGNWADYSPPLSFQEDGSFQTSNTCSDWTKTGMRNQNIYTSRITQGIIVGSPGNTKPLGDSLGSFKGEPIPRAFVINVKNTTDEDKNFRLSIANQPSSGGRASFLEFEDLDWLDVTVAKRASISRSVFVYSPGSKDTVRVDITEYTEPNGEPVPDGLESSVVLNPDIMNPDIMNPDIMNPDIMNPDIMNYEYHNPDIMNFYVNPDIMNPDIMNPDIMNPDIMNLDIMNPDIMNPDIMNPDIMNPDIMNPDIMNPDIMNPDIMNPDIMNPAIDDPTAGTFADVTWDVQNAGNTTSSYTFKTLSTAADEQGNLPLGIQAQLLIYRIYSTPNEDSGIDSNGSTYGTCNLGKQEHHDLVLNIINPDIMNPDIMNADVFSPDIMNPDIMNASFSLEPSGVAKVILRLWKPYNFQGAWKSAQVAQNTDWNDILYNSFNGYTAGTARNTDDLQAGIPTYPDDSSLFMINNKIMKPGDVGQDYSDFLTASGGNMPYTWAVVGGVLPNNLDLNPTTGEIYSNPSSPPDTAGTYTFTAQVTDDDPQIRTKDVWIIIRPAAGGYTISGRAFSGGVGLGGVTMSGLPNNPVTDSVGFYTDTVNASWFGTVTPQLSGYNFNPAQIVYDDVSSNLIGQNYTATPLFGALDHFDFDTISDQTVGTAFSITITAKDSGGNTIETYSGTNTLSDTTGTINPTTTGAFVNGAWTGDVTISAVGSGVTITTTDAGKTGVSNAFDVISGLPQDDSYEPNDDFGSAALIPAGTYTNLQLFDDDWYRISVNAGMYLKVTITGESGNNIDLGLADSTGKYLVGGISSSNTETVYYYTPSAGDYYIRVPYTWGGDLQNTYTLKVEVSVSDIFGMGHVSGTVTDSSDNTPLHVRVRIIDEYGFRRWNTLTDVSTGDYKISLPAGRYKIRFMTYPILDYYGGINYLNEYYDDRYPSSMASLVDVQEGGNLYDIDGFLEPGGTITGTVTDQTGNIEGAYVRIRDLHGYSVDSAYSDETGQYMIERLHPGYYKAYVRSFTENHGIQWYNDTSSFDEANAFYVDSSQPAAGINFQLTVGGSVSGRVTDGNGGIEGIRVVAFDPSQTVPFLYPSAQIPQIGLVATWTDEYGDYVLEHLPPGDVKIYFNTPNTHHVPEWYDNNPDFEDSDAVMVQAGLTTSNIDAVLAEGGSIGGRATDALVDGNGIKDVLVWIFNDDGWGYYQKYVYTDDEGYYFVDGVPVGSVKVRFRPNISTSPPENWAVEWYNNQNSYTAAQVVTVVANQTTWNIDAELAFDGGRIEGRVTNGSQGIGGVQVVAYDSSIQAMISNAYTDANGYYSVPRIPTCSVKLAFFTDDNKLPYLSEFYDDSPSYALASPVSVALGATTPLSDVVLSDRPALTVITTSPLPDGDFGSPYSHALAATGGTVPYYWSLAQGSNPLPAGLILHGNGVIDGTPTIGGDFNFDVEVVDYSYPPRSATQNISITIDYAPGVATHIRVETEFDGSGTIVPAQDVPSGSFIRVYAISRDAVGDFVESVVAGTWELVNKTGGVDESTDLNGVQSYADFTGHLVGTAQIRATSQSLIPVDSGTITVTHAIPPPTITTTFIDDAVRDEAYSVTITAAGGAPSLEWSIIGGALPDGLNINSDTGKIAGTPIAAGFFEFTVQVEDSLSNADTQDYSTAVADWIVRYDNSINDLDEARAMTVDSFGNIYVTGRSEGDGTSTDYATIKYDSAGTENWAVRYASSKNSGNWFDRANAITSDALGNVYVTGSNGDYTTVKYNSSGGVEWVATYDGVGTGHDEPRAIAVDALGNVYVTGYSVGVPNNLDYATIKYDSAGTELWAKTFDGGINSSDEAFAIAVDLSGNVYVTGMGNRIGDAYSFDYATLKYDRFGNELWVRWYDGPGNYMDKANAITVDTSGDVYVTGYSRGISDDYATIKYDSLGNPLWNSGGDGAVRYDTSGQDQANAIVLDSSGYVYVTGRFGGDFGTIKYDPAGDQQWVATYNIDGMSFNDAHSIAVDPLGNVYVVGQTQVGGGDYDLATVIYDNSGNELADARYAGSSDYVFGGGRDIALDPFGNIYVTGTSDNGNDSDYVTIKYFQSFPTRLNITTESLDNGYAGIVYAAAVEAFGGTGSRTWSITSGNLPTGLNMNPSTGVISGTPTTAGIFDFDVTVVDGVLSDFKSFSISIRAGLASQLVFTQQPNGCTAGEIWTQQPIVEVQDAFGNTITSDDSTQISLTIDYNPSDGTLSPSDSATVTVTAGVTTFTSLSIDNSGSGYKLEATSSPNYTAATSDAFDVNAKITGLVKFNNQAFSEKNPNVEPSFFVQVEGTGSELEGYTTEYSTSSGTYTIYNVPPGAQYNISTSIHTIDPPDGYLFPGEFYGHKGNLHILAGEAEIYEDLHVEQVINLTGPINNNDPQPWPVYPFDEDVSPVDFAWNNLPGGEADNYTVNVYLSDGNTSTLFDSETGIPDTHASFTLPLSDAGEHYEFEIWAYNGSVRVGRFMIVFGDGQDLVGWGWYYQFRVTGMAGIGYVTDQINDVQSSTTYSCAGEGSLYQSFRPSAWTLAAVTLKLQAGGSFPQAGYDSTIRIRESAPYGPILATSTTFIQGPLVPGEDITAHFDITPPLIVTIDNTYYIEWISGDPAVLQWYLSESDTYPRGEAFECTEFPIVPPDDFHFITYTCAVMPDPIIAVSPQALSIEALTSDSSPRVDMFDVGNPGGSDLEYTVSDDADWLTINPTDPGPLTPGWRRNHAALVYFKSPDLEPGVYNATIMITATGAGALNSPQTIDVTFTLSQALEITTGWSLPDGVFGEAYSTAIEATGGTGNYTWSLISAPNWISIDPDTGVLSGVPDTSGTHQVQVHVEDPGPPLQEDEEYFAIIVPQPFDLVSVPNPQFTEGSGDNPDGWESFNNSSPPGSPAFGRPYNPYHGQPYSLSIVCPTCAGSSYSGPGWRTIDWILVDPYKSYTLYAWIRYTGTPISGERVELSISYESGSVSQNHIISNLTPEVWHQVYLAIGVLDPSGQRNEIKIAFQRNSAAGSEATVYFDDVELRANYGPATYFLTNPYNAVDGQTLYPAVQVKKVNQNGVGMEGEQIDLILYNDDYGGTLSGNTSVVTDEDGIATFNNLSIDKGGWNRILKVVDAFGVYSALFDVEGFSHIADMATARRSHTATLLFNEGDPLGFYNVLISGGTNPTDGPFRSAYLFQSANQQFVPVGEMTYKRTDHTATILPNKNVLIVGGYDDTDTLSMTTAEIYNNSTSSFTLLTETLTYWRRWHRATKLLDGRILFTGGSHPDAKTAEIYDPNQPLGSQFSTTGTFADDIPRYNHTATLLQSGLVLITGGRRSDVGMEYLASAQLYDPSAGTFRSIDDMDGGPRSLHRATLLDDGTVLITGGYSGAEALLTAEIYYPPSISNPDGRFGEIPNGMNRTHIGHAAIKLENGTVLLAGGGGAEIYDPSIYDPGDPDSKYFRLTGPLDVSRQECAAILFPPQQGNWAGIVLVTGGLGVTDPSASCVWWYPWRHQE